jgi:plasmid stability protein
MATFTVKNIPDDLLGRVRAAAEMHRRSINGEILVCLERAFGAPMPPAEVIRLARELRQGFQGQPLDLDDLNAAKSLGRP